MGFSDVTTTKCLLSSSVLLYFTTQFSDLHSDVVEGAGCPASLPLSFGMPLRPVCTFHSSDVLLSWFEKQDGHRGELCRKKRTTDNCSSEFILQLLCSI